MYSQLCLVCSLFDQSLAAVVRKLWNSSCHNLLFFLGNALTPLIVMWPISFFVVALQLISCGGLLSSRRNLWWLRPIVDCIVFIGERLSTGDEELRRRGHIGASKEEDGSWSSCYSANGHNRTHSFQYQWAGRAEVTEHCLITSHFLLWCAAVCFYGSVIGPSPAKSKWQCITIFAFRLVRAFWCYMFSDSNIPLHTLSLCILSAIFLCVICVLCYDIVVWVIIYESFSGYLHKVMSSRQPFLE